MSPNYVHTNVLVAVGAVCWLWLRMLMLNTGDIINLLVAPLGATPRRNRRRRPIHGIRVQISRFSRYSRHYIADNTPAYFRYEPDQTLRLLGQ